MQFDDGRLIYLPATIAGRFNLLTARTLLERGEAARRAALAEVYATESGSLRLSQPTLMFDAYGDLIAAVLLAFAGIEAYANEAIERLPDEYVLRITRRGGEQEIEKNELARRLSISEKLDRVGPVVASRRSIRGTKRWDEFKRLKDLRDSLVHLKRRGYSPDPEEPSEFAQLARGNATESVATAARVIEAAEPGWIPSDVLAKLTAPV